MPLLRRLSCRAQDTKSKSYHKSKTWGRVMRVIRRVFRRIISWIRFRTYRRYHVINTGLKPGWRSFPEVALFALFKEFLRRWEETREKVDFTTFDNYKLAYEELEEAAFYWKVRPELEAISTAALDEWFDYLPDKDWKTRFNGSPAQTPDNRERFLRDRSVAYDRELYELDRYYCTVLIKNWHHIDW